MVNIDIQNPVGFEDIPNSDNLQKWVVAALQKSRQQENISLVIRFVDEREGSALNHAYRQKPEEAKKATNVLSFPSEYDDFGILELNELNQQEKHLGDLVLCVSVVKSEAQQQKKTLLSHWAHLVVHGTLHLQGYDHIEVQDAQIMEALEVKILKGLGFENPYKPCI